jgi:hypothetical protein
MKRVPVDGLGQRKYAVRRDWRDTHPPAWITSVIYEKLCSTRYHVVLRSNSMLANLPII